jgi:NADH-quinone oxidoreductase subunit M
LYERYHTREINQYSGMAKKLPIMALFMLLFTFSSIGLPGMNGFVGEFMILLGMFQRAWMGQPGLSATMGLVIAAIAVSGVVLGAWYMLQLVQKVFWGPLREPSGEHGEHHAEIKDLNIREILALSPLVLFIVWIGIRPNDFLPAMDKPIREVLTATQNVNAALPQSVSAEAGETSAEELARVR